MMESKVITVQGLDQAQRQQYMQAVYANTYPQLTGVGEVRVLLQVQNTDQARLWLRTVRQHYTRKQVQFSWPMTHVQEVHHS